jgi:N-acetylglutamate synthase-like GNAT family acetyltransferase
VGTALIVESLYDQLFSASVFALAIAEHEQGKGYGKALLQKIEAEVKNLGKKQVRLYSSISPSFYLANGYTSFGEIAHLGKHYQFLLKDL